MQSKKTSAATSKKPAKKPTKKTANKVTKKTSKKPPRRVAKKTTQRPSKKAPAKPAEGSAKRAPEQHSSNRAPKKSSQPILVPIDFSAYSTAALEHAVVLSECLQAPITVLHVVHDPGDAPGYYQVKGRKKQLRRLEDVAGEMLDEFMDKFVNRHPKHPTLKKSKRLLVTGLPVNRILEVAKKIQPSMMVIGSAGRTGLSRFLLGSKAEQLIRASPFSVTVVKLPNDR